MGRSYKCLDCGKACADPVYVRLFLTRCGLRQARKQPHRHAVVSLGHLCSECLTNRLHTAIGPQSFPEKVQAFLVSRSLV